MDDAGRVNPYEHLAFPGTGLLRLVVGEPLAAIAGAQTNRLHAPLPNKHLSAELELDDILFIFDLDYFLRSQPRCHAWPGKKGMGEDRSPPSASSFFA